METNVQNTPDIPTPLEVIFAGIPPELQQYPFVLWKYVNINGELNPLSH